MKLVRYGASGREKPGLIDSGGVLRDRLDFAEPCSARRPGVSQAASRAPYLAHRTSRTARPPAPIASPAPLMSPRMRAT